MNASGNLNPRADRNQYIPIHGRYPIESGYYMVNIRFLGVEKVRYCNGAFFWDNGDVIPDSLILGWK